MDLETITYAFIGSLVGLLIVAFKKKTDESSAENNNASDESKA